MERIALALGLVGGLLIHDAFVVLATADARMGWGFERLVC